MIKKTGILMLVLVMSFIMTGCKSKKESEVLDLTEMNGDTLYAQVYNMVTKPEEYKGKIVKIKGEFSAYNDKELGKLRTGVVIKDALACCKEGIEFEPKKKCKYPEDYPKEGEDVIVTGRFDAYKHKKSDPYLYYVLREAKFEKVKENEKNNNR